VEDVLENLQFDGIESHDARLTSVRQRQNSQASQVPSVTPEPQKSLTHSEFDVIFAPGTLLIASRRCTGPRFQGEYQREERHDADEEESCEEEKETLSELQPR
jgi:hypothetical protein